MLLLLKFLHSAHPLSLKKQHKMANHTTSSLHLTSNILFAAFTTAFTAFTTTCENMLLRRFKIPIYNGRAYAGRGCDQRVVMCWPKRRYTSDSSFSHITATQWETISKYEAELMEWNKKMNLISRKDAAVPGKIMSSHIIPCLSISILRPFLPGETILDAG